MPRAVRTMDFKEFDYSAENADRIKRLMEAVVAHPEIAVAVGALVFNLEAAPSEPAEDRAWDGFNDRITAIISRVKNGAIK